MKRVLFMGLLAFAGCGSNEAMAPQTDVLYLRCGGQTVSRSNLDPDMMTDIFDAIYRIHLTEGYLDFWDKRIDNYDVGRRVWVEVAPNEITKYDSNSYQSGDFKDEYRMRISRKSGAIEIKSTIKMDRSFVTSTTTGQCKPIDPPEKQPNKF